ncbi:hypothetical protein K8Q94_03495 [Candidatus Nomurabacteria bacterium]|nr:hypothetical protein [Candidatus Nomurabacteria bacterium]
MIEIKDLLLRFSNILLSEEIKKKAIRDIISEIIKTDIKSEDIKIKNGTIYLNIKPIYKNEIFLKQEKIFFKLAETLGQKSPQNFR